MESQEEPLQSLLKNLKTYVNPFHRAARNMATWAEAPVSIVHGLLSSKEKGKECLIEFIEKRLLSPEKEIYKPNKRSCIQITIEKKKKPREISILKEDRLALGLFVANYAVKKEAFSYLLITYPLALSTAQGTLYKPCTKYLFRNYLIDYMLWL